MAQISRSTTGLFTIGMITLGVLFSMVVAMPNGDLDPARRVRRSTTVNYNCQVKRAQYLDTNQYFNYCNGNCPHNSSAVEYSFYARNLLKAIDIGALSNIVVLPRHKSKFCCVPKTWVNREYHREAIRNTYRSATSCHCQ